jgi:integron integrase
MDEKIAGRTAGGGGPIGLFPGEPYVHWMRRFLAFHKGTHPRELAESDVNRFLTHLAVRENVAASTQNQALAALLFLYEHVLEQPLNRLEGVVRARRPKRLPSVLTREEVEAVLGRLEGVAHLAVMVLYGGGLRLLEALQLRVKDLDFGRSEITIREGKGQKDRVTMLPVALRGALEEHLRRVREQHGRDLQNGQGRAPLPEALIRKYPNAGREWLWQWVFPASSYYMDRRTGLAHRHHLHESVI